MSLRMRLRTETRAAHEQLDHIADGLDLTMRRDYIRFLLAHRRAYAALHAARIGLTDLLARRISQVDQDLAHFDIDATADATEDLPIDPDIEMIGLSYVILGSHLGAVQIAKQVGRSDDLSLRAATTMLTDQTLAPLWRDFVQASRNLPDTGADADRIILSATHTFSLFEAAFRSVIDADAA
ncbi:biliverdin-producing heme oxygenase [Algimonas porphyrae]|uniref:Heme oxygenase n=1 Tax=Algimonas porphyrae TaxID=1128113 RepID=A0ABQ5V6G4_9PROT|nr:biliverdin-producing heme oxygenase [Algimonas porphyrae]GLQ21862.1 hypothetical protein GCM10007854_28170 [Algimonas porphyrae]